MLLNDKHHLQNLESEKNFGERLAQTIYWCAGRADVSNPRDSLRTPELCPRPFEESRFSAVETVATARRWRGGDEILKIQLPPDLAGGRLLA